MIPIILHLDAGRDTNGNPRRVYVILDPETRTIIETTDEGYRGHGAYSGKYPGATVTLQIPTTAAYRRELLRAR